MVNLLGPEKINGIYEIGGIDKLFEFLALDCIFMAKRQQSIIEN